MNKRPDAVRKDAKDSEIRVAETSLVLDTYSMSYNETPPWGMGPALWTQVVLPPKIRRRFVPAGKRVRTTFKNAEFTAT
jgi:hypothetical protein